jgi:predicted RNA-binding protein with RPS1 domain
VVRDHSGRLQAAQYALKVDQEVRKLLGLDAAQKMDLNVNQAEEERAEQLARDAARRLAGTDDTKELDSNGDR